MLQLVIIVAWIAVVLADTVSVVLEKVIHDPLHFNWAVESKIFHDYDNEHLFITSRGGSGSIFSNSSTHAGLARFNIAKDPLSPQLVDVFAPSGANESLEGIDRCGELLVVISIDRGILYTLNASCLSCGPLGMVNLSTNRALHSRLYFRPDDKSMFIPWGGCGYGQRGRLFAITTSGFAEEQSGAFSNALMAVDVTDPRRPVEVARLDGMPSAPEGIYVHNEHGYVGGCEGSSLLVVDLRRLPLMMSIAAEIHDPSLVQLVSTQRGYDYNSSTMLLALWGDRGGLAAFHLKGDGSAELLSKLVSNDLGKANRVVLDTAHNLAFLPLEQTPAQVAIVDVSDPKDLHLAAPILEIPSSKTQNGAVQGVTYCLAVTGSYFYVFVAETQDMYIYRFAVSNGTRHAQTGIEKLVDQQLV